MSVKTLPDISATGGGGGKKYPHSVNNTNIFLFFVLFIEIMPILIKRKIYIFNKDNSEGADKKFIFRMYS